MLLGTAAISLREPCRRRARPEIIPLIKRVVYMGGSFFKPEHHAHAGFNWWLDPRAAKICLHPVQGTDHRRAGCLRDALPQKQVRRSHITQNPDIKKMLKRNFLNALFLRAGYVHYIWDVIAGAIVMDPSLITDEVTRYVDVNSQFGFSYGQAVAFETNQPVGTQQARIILAVDNDRLWKMVEDYCAKF